MRFLLLYLAKLLVATLAVAGLLAAAAVVQRALTYLARLAGAADLQCAGFENGAAAGRLLFGRDGTRGLLARFFSHAYDGTPRQ
ncbi:MAG: hypothetical protein ABSC51_10630 [Gaiellaceae bacterium]|jgi:hypothetical protein